MTHFFKNTINQIQKYPQLIYDNKETSFFFDKIKRVVKELKPDR